MADECILVALLYRGVVLLVFAHPSGLSFIDFHQDDNVPPLLPHAMVNTTRYPRSSFRNVVFVERMLLREFEYFAISRSTCTGVHVQVSSRCPAGVGQRIRSEE